jgi:hypothetical protein
LTDEKVGARRTRNSISAIQVEGIGSRIQIPAVSIEDLQHSSPPYVITESRRTSSMDQLVVRLQDPKLPDSNDPELTWVNVGIALSFILIDGSVSPCTS